MHGDHMFGAVPLLCTLMNGAGGSVGVEDPRNDAAGELGDKIRGKENVEPDIELYGPQGLREYIRSSLRLTRSMLGGTYVVHELHVPEQGEEAAFNSRGKDVTADRGPMELLGYNIFPNEKGTWLDILTLVDAPNKEWTISAGPILHSVPCVGYVLTEPPLPGKITPEYRNKIMANKNELVKGGIKNPMSLLSKVTALAAGEAIDLPNGDKLERPPDRKGRKITILGDTCDPSGIAELANRSDVLIHEATNAFLGGLVPKEINKDYKEGETYEDVRRKTFEHGHSTPEMAAEFAIGIGIGEAGGVLGRLVESDPEGKKGKGKADTGEPKGILLLNHFSSRYADPRSSEAAKAIMGAIRESAIETTLREAEIKASRNGGQTGSNIEVVCAYDLMQYEIRASD
ncbi:hypothetical protein ABW19_dt0208766 [Dactylella cylindrospora]|nr:hypothetical protein ABW19_dt0208766 [Dactylella cylindrospora]